MLTIASSIGWFTSSASTAGSVTMSVLITTPPSEPAVSMPRVVAGRLDVVDGVHARRQPRELVVAVGVGHGRDRLIRRRR